jgi:flagellar basal body-associated protein FliL
MSEEAQPQAPAAPKKKGGKLLFVVAAVLSVGAGAATPMFVNVPALLGKEKEKSADEGDDGHAKTTAKKKKGHAEEKTVSIPFGDVVVNLAEERLTRYLRLKIVLVVEEEAEAEVTALLEKKKATMKSWLISHLTGKTLKDVAGTVGVNRTQREILERFEDTLYPSGHGHLKHIMFEEYLVQ